MYRHESICMFVCACLIQTQHTYLFYRNNGIKVIPINLILYNKRPVTIMAWWPEPPLDLTLKAGAAPSWSVRGAPTAGSAAQSGGPQPLGWLGSMVLPQWADPHKLAPTSAWIKALKAGGYLAPSLWQVKAAYSPWNLR